MRRGTVVTQGRCLTMTQPLNTYQTHVWIGAVLQNYLERTYLYSRDVIPAQNILGTAPGIFFFHCYSLQPGYRIMVIPKWWQAIMLLLSFCIVVNGQKKRHSRMHSSRLPAFYTHGSHWAIAGLLWCGSNLTTVLWSPCPAPAPNSQAPGHAIKIKVFLIKWFWQDSDHRQRKHRHQVTL